MKGDASVFTNILLFAAYVCTGCNLATNSHDWMAWHGMEWMGGWLFYASN